MRAFAVDQLLWTGRRLVLLPAPADDVAEYDDLVAVVFAWYGWRRFVGGRNVWAFDRRGRKLWEIDPVPNQYSSAEIPGPDQYSWIGERDGRLQAYSMYGYDWDVDPATGRISNPRFVK